MDADTERECREEAERLRTLSRDEQRAIVELHRSVADDPKVSKVNRELARSRFEALEKLLKLKPRKKTESKQ